ncbi:F-box domain, cyclin-like protein [Artemisia annua]|uniref:Tubby-like F-box protein n=1 Tax=Artemisia annua TaxID=35608 RepID=A0A2U1KDX0_ARTAN|nr:F-box domain, cyclin-like protein [Artemisia annua]
MNSSNFLGTKFSVYDTQHSYDPAMKPTPKFSLKKVSPVVPLVVKSKVATILYELNVLRTKGPRRMHCTMNLIPASLVQEGGSTRTTLTQPTFPDQTTQNHLPESSILDKTEPLILKNKAPRWHEQLQCWCLNFKGRVTVASVKNFQLAVDSSQNGEAAEQDDVILQFGKIGKDIFTMDYQYPLSAFQAFAICLSSFDTKPACE